MKEPNDPFVQMLDAYKAAVYAKDVDAFAALYDDDVHVFDLWGGWTLRGKTLWREMASEWFSSLGDERVVVNVRGAHCVIADELAAGHAILTYAAVSTDGKELRSLSNRATMTLKRIGGAWKIVHEHTSAPIDKETLKAQLRYPGND